MMKFFLCLGFFALGFTSDAHSQTNYKPQRGYVPDAKTAVSIAVAVWVPIYGEKQIQGEKPYHAVLNHGVWTVSSSLPKFIIVRGIKEVVTGGVALAEISKADGRVLRVIHGK